MKDKIFTNNNPYFQETFQLRCWTPIRNSKYYFFKRLLRRYQKIIDTAFATTIIGTMFLAGIWCFLAQLAEY